jgi:hypothetical protein
MGEFTEKLRTLGDTMDRDLKWSSGTVGLAEAVPNLMHRKGLYKNKLDQFRESQRSLQAISALQNTAMNKQYRDSVNRMDAGVNKNLGERGRLLRTIGANKALLYS